MKNSYFGFFVVVSVLTVLFGFDRLNSSRMNQATQLRNQNIEGQQTHQLKEANPKHFMTEKNTVAIEDALND